MTSSNAGSRWSPGPPSSRTCSRRHRAVPPARPRQALRSRERDARGRGPAPGGVTLAVVRQVRFPGYTETTGLDDGQRWRKRNVIDQPYRFHEVSQLLDVGSHLKLAPEAEVKSISQQTVAGRPAFCVETGPTAALWQLDIAGRAAIPEVARWKDSRASSASMPTRRPSLRRVRDRHRRPPLRRVRQGAAALRVRGPGHPRHQGVPQDDALLRGEGACGRSDRCGAGCRLGRPDRGRLRGAGRRRTVAGVRGRRRLPG